MSLEPPPANNPLIEAAERELNALIKEDADIEARRAKLQQKIVVVCQTLDALRRAYGVSNRGLGGEPVNADLGISDQIREILKIEYPVYLKPTTIRNYLEHFGFLKTKDGKDYENPLALVHQILKRLEVRNEVEAQITAEGAKLYRWKPQPGLAAQLIQHFSTVGPQRTIPAPQPSEFVRKK